MEVKSINDQKKFLIDFSNLKQNIICSQKNFTDYKNLKKILNKPYLGIPLILPLNIRFFSFDKKDIFKVDKELIKKKLFRTNNDNYSPFKNFFSFSNYFIANPKLKPKYAKEIKKINNLNYQVIKKISKFKKQGKIIGAFQSRNIPHLGHEKLINKLLKKFYIVFINPVFGVKKRGDVKTSMLKKAYNFLIKNYYSKKLVFAPLYASMFYAGPREALHHAILRENLGFDYFIVGRDHAGAEGNYKGLDAIKLITRYKKKLKIKILTSPAAYYCKSCDKIVLKHDKHHKCKYKKLLDISGTDFRKHIIDKKIFKHARVDLQKYIHKLKDKIFY